MDINKNQQTNTFGKGMNTDTSDLYIPNDQYRYAKNLRFLTNEGENSGELRSIEDWKNIAVLNKNWEILATTSIRKYGILVVKAKDGEQDLYQIWRYDTDTDTVHQLYEDSESFGDSISLVTRWEDSDNVKLYISDGVHPLMYLNIIPDDILNMNDILSVTLHNFGGISVTNRITGKLKPAIVQYSYILYKRYGKRTQMSQLSQPESLYSNNTYGDFGYSNVEYTNIGLTLQVLETKGVFDSIRIYRISYIQIGQQPTIDVIYDGKLNEGSYFTFSDVGQNAINTISVAEYNSMRQMQIIPKIIESKNNYLFASNIMYGQYGDQEFLNAYNNFDSKCFSVGGEDNENLDLSQEYDKEKWLSPGEETIGGKGTNIQWWFSRGVDNNSYAYIDDFTHHEKLYKSLRRDEVYRYGIILYDAYGNAWPVKWVADIRTPSCKFANPVINSNYGFRINPLQIAFQVNIPQEIREMFPKYEIVRCERTINDSATISQGLLGKTFEHMDYNAKYLGYNTASGFITLGTIQTRSGFKNGDDAKFASTTGANHTKLYQFCSPEISYVPTDTENVLNNSSNLYIQPVYTSKIKLEEETLDDDHLWIEYDPNDTNIHSYEGVKLSDNKTLYKIPNGLKFFKHDGYVNITNENLFKSIPGSVYNIEYEYPEPNYEKTFSKYNFNLDSVKENSYGIKTIHNLIQLDGTIQYYQANSDNISITDYKYSESPKWSDFTNQKNFNYMNSSVYIGNINYVPWSVPLTVNPSGEYSSRMTGFYESIDRAVPDYINEQNYNLDEDKSFRYPIGTAGSCMLLNLTENTRDPYDILPVSVYNLRKYTVPYGGYSESARQNSVYISFGECFSSERTAPFIMYDGDCNIQTFYYNALHTWWDPTYIWAPKMSTVYAVPVETEIDMYSESGHTYRRNSNPNIQDQPAVFKNYVQTKPSYFYNTAYSSQPNIIKYYGIQPENLVDNKYDYRIHYSDPKINNEYIDNWLNFKASNFIDVDTRFGQITNTRLFKDAFIFWQESATGMLSVNERTILQDVNDTNIILGNADVLQRYDYITTEYGMKPGQFADTQSNTSLYWWDGYKKEILGYSGGQSLIPMNKIKTISNYINSRSEIKDPELAYDYKYNEVLMNVVDGGPLMYNEVTQQFVSIYEHSFSHSMRFKEYLVITDNNKAYKYNGDTQYLLPTLKYIVNDNPQYVKVYDNCNFGLDENYDDTSSMNFRFHTKDQDGELDSSEITNREYDYRFAIPRNNHSEYSDRLRGKFMQCELTVDNSTDFSIQYIITKYRISWS